ncbi:MAG: hypothetical protein FD123_3971 [Bacteroidetes bacterium]|nr:MAG: hypothetical protein FD123_3971 [Bacteroidota bacterium]
MKRILTFLPLALAPFTGFAQGKTYFQQDVKYNITVQLDDVKHELTGFETLEYVNNSPDALPFIWMHIWPNAYKQNGTALEKQVTDNGETALHFSDRKDRGYIDQLDFKVDGQAAKTEAHPEHIDIIKLVLNQPLQPGGKITITTPFHVKIPSGKFSRLGHIGQQYQITQWYPKPAVYDRNGWNEMPYLDQGEFYSEFGTYDVFITLPKNYVVGSTGDLTGNDDEVRWLDERAKASQVKIANRDTTVKPGVKKTWMTSDSVRSAAETKTLHYHQENVHDFAWFCDKSYNVLKSSVKLPHTNHEVTTWVMFTDRYTKVWKNATTYVNDALYYYSLWNGDYPYNHCTAVDGALSAGGGMEYPNITVIGATGDPMTLETVIMHEVGHNWFYGLLGSNERMHAWMDEGINSYNELRYIETKYPEKRMVGDTNGPNKFAKIANLERYRQKAQYYQLYAFSARQDLDQSLTLPAAEFTSINYAGMVYYKTAIAFDYLRSYLGEPMMDKCMQTYFDRWHFRHPMPSDIRAVFEEVTGKNLSWFFDDMIGSDKNLDYKITSKNKKADGTWEITVKNTGEIKGPVALSGVKDGKIRGIIWYEGFDDKQTLGFPEADIDYFILDFFEDIPEINRKNNRVYTHGLFKKTEPLKIQFLGSLDNPERTQLFWTPALGWNKYNGFMLGAAVYNHVAPQKHFEWMLIPMYGFKNKNLAGHADVFFHINPGKVFQQVDIGANFNRYCYSNDPLKDLDFNKIAPEINFTFKKKRLRSNFNQGLRLRGILLLNDGVAEIGNFEPPLYNYTTTDKRFYEATYSFRNSRKVNPFGFSVNALTGDTMTKITLTGNYRLDINEKKRIDIRVFGGTFLNTTAANANPYRFRMSGWRGYNDYLFDHVYFGRSEYTGLGAAQMAERDGAFKVYTPLGQSAVWLAAMNVKADIPFDVKFLNNVRLFADVGACETDGRNTQTVIFDAGVNITLFRGFGNIYIPLIMSTDLKDVITANDWKFAETIRFELRLEQLAPSALIKQIDF